VYKKDLINEALKDIEYFEDKALLKKEKILKKVHRKNHRYVTPSNDESSVYKELKEIIICKDLTKVCIKRWDELEINFLNPNEKFCSKLNKKVIKVTNEYNYNLVKNDDICIAIPYNGVLQKLLDDNILKYIADYVFIQVSRSLILSSCYSEQYDIQEFEIHKAIKYIVSYIQNNIENNKYIEVDDWIRWYKEFDIDLTKYLDIIKFA